MDELRLVLVGSGAPKPGLLREDPLPRELRKWAEAESRKPKEDHHALSLARINLLRRAAQELERRG